MENTAIVVCSTKGHCLPILLTSVERYVPKEVSVYTRRTPNVPVSVYGFNHCLSFNEATNFGDAYNAVVREAFRDGAESVVLVNDDVVLTPHTWPNLVRDIAAIQATWPDEKIGYVAARSDFARGRQNIRLRNGNEQLHCLRWPSEDSIERADVIAPIFAWISKEAWVDFPPLNWYSDDVQCHDIRQRGYQHFIGTSYVHHVGSQTCGQDFAKLKTEAGAWLKDNRPELHEKWFIGERPNGAGS